MICPNCSKPYFFLRSEKELVSHCLRCKHKETFSHPSYNDYHQNLYTTKPYVRTEATDPQMKRILAKLRIQPTDTILDIGCGVGDYTKAISHYTRNVIGLDQNVASAQEKYPDLHFANHDCNQMLSFDDSSVDSIVSINLVEHLVHYKTLLFECHRVLKPKGRIAITTANLDFFLHDFFFDKTHVYEWTLPQFIRIMQEFFPNIILAEKSGAMFNYHPINKLATLILKPDLLIIAEKV